VLTILTLPQIFLTLGEDSEPFLIRVKGGIYDSIPQRSFTNIDLVYSWLGLCAFVGARIAVYSVSNGNQPQSSEFFTCIHPKKPEGNTVLVIWDN
jgi:hypothetical protein